VERPRKSRIRINSFGFRGRRSGPKTGRTTRIFFLGDSITLGEAAGDDVRQPRRRRVGRARSTHYEVINAGVGDVGLYEEEETLKTRAQGQPDVVCFVVSERRPPRSASRRKSSTIIC